jgi:hypothetical protein
MFIKSTRWTVGLALALAFTLCVCGCSQTLVGTWKADPAPKDVPNYIVQAKFNKDGTYEATMKGDAEPATPQKGQYEYNGFSLKLKQPSKTEQVYPATCIFGTKLEVKQNGKSYMMKKQ